MENPQSLPISFDDDGRPSLAVTLLNGQLQGWPLHVLTSWSFEPVNAQANSPDGNRYEVLRVQVGADILVLKGEGLSRIADALSEGRGGRLYERGERYHAIRMAGAPFIAAAKVESGELHIEPPIT